MEQPQEPVQPSEYTPIMWRDDLLSGRYQRSIGRLTTTWPVVPHETDYCCLGVLAERIGATFTHNGCYIGETFYGSALAVSAHPSAVTPVPWLSGKAAALLAQRNDTAEFGPGWAPNGPVVRYIEKYIIPAWEATQNG